MLTLRLGNFFLLLVALKLFLEILVDHETRPNVVDVFAFCSQLIQILGNVEVGLLGGFDHVAVDFTRKGSEILDVDSLSLQHFLLDVFGSGPEDDVKL